MCSVYDEFVDRGENMISKYSIPLLNHRAVMTAPV